jgi:hypothetical protein
MIASPTVQEPKSPLPDPERRTQVRADVAIDFHITTATEGIAVPAKLRNISWGGAEFTSCVPPGEVGSHIWLKLPWKASTSISVKAKILRCRQDAKHRYTVGVRFSRVAPEQNEKLQELLTTLFKAGGGGPADDLCLSKQLNLMFDDPAEMRSTLDLIAQGSLAVTVVGPFEHNDSLQLLISDLNEVPVVSLRGRVARQTPLNTGGTELYRLNLAFEHSIKELQAHVYRALEWTQTRQ